VIPLVQRLAECEVRTIASRSRVPSSWSRVPWSGQLGTLGPRTREFSAALRRRWHGTRQKRQHLLPVCWLPTPTWPC